MYPAAAMAEVLPFNALRYDLRAVGELESVIAPPYDVIDDELRAELVAKSPFNVVEIDLPRHDEDAYLHAQTTFEAWRQQSVLVRDREPALWLLEQRYAAPDGSQQTRLGFFAKVRVEDYGPGRIRPHERTHPGPKEDRLNLTRATRANLSPIFSLFDDPGGAAMAALDRATTHEPFATVKDHEGTENTLWRVADADATSEVRAALEGVELLIADGHHRYETARVYAEEIGGEGEHRYVLMLLCSLADPGLLVFPTHRLLTDLDKPKQEAIRDTIKRDFEIEEITADELEPPPDADTTRVEFGYMDSFHKQAYRLTLKDQAIADAALEGKPEPYRRLDAAVLEAIVLRGALGMSEDDISHLNGLQYSKSTADAREQVESGRVDAGFFLRATPVDQVREVAAEGESMPPKSTYFYPKVPTGLVFNLLE